jgi:phospholipid/cholesterol/gamma-HCH transport system substrate-binding protein
MSERWKNILIGTFVMAALCIGAGLVFFLKPTIGDGHKSLRVRFVNIAGINKGTRVTYAGRPVGEVACITEVPNARLDPDEAGRIYSFELVLRLDSSSSVFLHDEIAIRTTGLMGERSVAILPKAPPAGKAPQLVRDQVLFANSVDPFDHTINQISRVATKVEQSLAQFDEWFQKTAPTLTATTAQFGGAAEALQDLFTMINDPLNQSFTLLAETLKKVREEQILPHFGVVLQSLKDTITEGAVLLSNLRQMTTDLNKGNSTAGRFLKGDDFYLRLSSLMNKGETLMNDINHYGILFQYNKQWQKTRTKRIHQLNALESPQDFKMYFEGEIDTISTSIGRICSLLERAEQEEERMRVMQSDSFKRDFAILLRQIQALNDALKLYNQDLVARTE